MTSNTISIRSILNKLGGLFSKSISVYRVPKYLPPSSFFMKATFDKVIEQLKVDEGYRRNLYKCTANKWTIGIGYNIEDRGLPDEVITQLAYTVLIECYEDLCSIFTPEYFRKLPEHKQMALLNMMYNLGKPTFLKFKRFIPAVKEGRWEAARVSALNSLWAKQVGNRARRIADALVKD